MSLDSCLVWAGEYDSRRRYEDIDWTVGATPKKKEASTVLVKRRVNDEAKLAPRRNQLPVNDLEAAVQGTLRQLAEQWRNDTMLSSSLTEITLHPAYQRIIGHGPAAIPFLIEQVKNNGLQWFPALKAITGADPVPAEDRGRVRAMRDAWIRWASDQGAIY